MATTYFGAVIRDGELNVAVVEKQFRSVRISGLYSRPVEGEPSGALKAALDELGYDPETDQLAAVLPGERLTSRRISLPLNKRPQIEEALPFEVEAASPFDAEDIVCGYTLIESSAIGVTALAAVAKREDVERTLETWSAAGADPAFVLPGPMALCSEARRKPPSETGLEIFVSLHEQALTIALARGPRPVAFHSARLRPGKEVEAAAMEVKRRMIALAATEEGMELTGVAVAGNHAEQLAGRLRDEVDAPVRMIRYDGFETSEGAFGPGARRERAAMFAESLGAAILAAEEPDTPANLRVGSYKRKTGLAGYRAQYVTAGVLLAIGLLALAVSFASEIVSLNNRYGEIRAAVRSEFKKALPEVRNIVSETRQLKTALARLEDKSKALGLTARGGDPFLDIFAEVTTAAPTDSSLDIAEFSYAPSMVTLAGTIESFEKVDQYKKNLEKLSWVSGVTVGGAKAGVAAGSVSFRLEVKAAQ